MVNRVTASVIGGGCFIPNLFRCRLVARVGWTVGITTIDNVTIQELDYVGGELHHTRVVRNTDYRSAPNMKL